MSKTKKPFSHYEQLNSLFELDEEMSTQCLNLQDSDGASNSSHIAGDPALSLAFFDHLWPYAYPRLDKLPFATRLARKLAKDGIINTALLFEKAISKQGRIKRDSTFYKDFVDLSDAKSASVRVRSNETLYTANISNIKSKVGALRIIVYERIHKQFYYFLIPAISNPRTEIEIPFTMSGNPITTDNARRRNNWWQFQVSTFNELCKPV